MKLPVEGKGTCIISHPDHSIIFLKKKKKRKERKKEEETYKLKEEIKHEKTPNYGTS